MRSHYSPHQPTPRSAAAAAATAHHAAHYHPPCRSIPVRFKPGVEGPEGVQVLLISSRKGKGHVFPKGGWEEDEGLSEAAMRETVEEAGVRGELEVGAAVCSLLLLLLLPLLLLLVVVGVAGCCGGGGGGSAGRGDSRWALLLLAGSCWR